MECGVTAPPTVHYFQLSQVIVPVQVTCETVCFGRIKSDADWHSLVASACFPIRQVAHQNDERDTESSTLPCIPLSMMLASASYKEPMRPANFSGRSLMLNMAMPKNRTPIGVLLCLLCRSVEKI